MLCCSWAEDLYWTYRNFGKWLLWEELQLYSLRTVGLRAFHFFFIILVSAWLYVQFLYHSWSNEHDLFDSFFKKLRGHDLLFWWPYLSPEICFDWGHQNVEHEKYWQFDKFSGYMLSGWTGKYIRGCAVYIIRKFNMIHGCNNAIWISISLWKVEKLCRVA